MTAGKFSEGPRILLAEDDEDDQEIITLAFKKLTSIHHVDIVNNGKEALEHLETLEDSELPCLIVLDLNMPVLNGMETLKLLDRNKKYKNIPKVVFSTTSDESSKKECLLSGATDFLIKPSDLNNILMSAKKMLQYCS